MHDGTSSGHGQFALFHCMIDTYVYSSTDNGSHLIYIIFVSSRVHRTSKCTNNMRLQLHERSLALLITSKLSPNTHILDGYYTFLVAVGIPKEI